MVLDSWSWGETSNSISLVKSHFKDFWSNKSIYIRSSTTIIWMQVCNIKFSCNFIDKGSYHLKKLLLTPIFNVTELEDYNSYSAPYISIDRMYSPSTEQYFLTQSVNVTNSPLLFPPRYFFSKDSMQGSKV
jgi:hypothetical protein